jgi:chemotaxis family two-component system response regulator PixG
MHSQSSPQNYLFAHLKECIHKQFTGQLDIQAPVSPFSRTQEWTLHFFMGRLVRANGGLHPQRRWRRHLSQGCPQLNSALEHKFQSSSPENHQWTHEFLESLARQQLIPREQVAQVVDGTVIEILFDIIQQEEISRFQGKVLTYGMIPQLPSDVKKPWIIPTHLKYLWTQAQQSWQAWRDAGLTDRSPDLAPIIADPDRLKQQISERNYLRLMSIVSGNRTLRDLAVKMGQDLLLLTQSIDPYVRRGLIRFNDLPDLNVNDSEEVVDPVTVIMHRPVAVPKAAASTPASEQDKNQDKMLVAYIDDSKLYVQVMGQIVSKLGYRFIGINDPLKALPTLLEHKPDLIFLDLVMPIVNGYEVCAQIRRVSTLSDVPIIMLTSNDGVVNRMRSHIVKASEFMPKPIDNVKIRNVLKRYLSSPEKNKLSTTNNAEPSSINSLGYASGT